MKDKVQAEAPPHRMDIGEGVIGLADVLEEVARSYGYENIPTTTMADALPPQIGNPVHEWEEHLRDLLVCNRLAGDRHLSHDLARTRSTAVASKIVPIETNYCPHCQSHRTRA